MLNCGAKAILSNYVKLLLQEREISGDTRKYKCTLDQF